MMKLDDFIKAASRHRRRSLWVMWPLIGAILLGMAYMPFADRVASIAQMRFGDPASEILRILPLAILIILAFGSAFLFERHNERRFSVPCPHCRQSLTHNHSIVIASKHCPHCGRRVLEDADPDDNAAPPDTQPVAT